MAAIVNDGITRCQDEEKATGRKHTRKCRWNDRTAAIVSGLLTFANGATSMITGIEGLIFGGQDLYQDSTVEVTIGTVVVFFAALVLLIVASPLEDSRRVLLICAPAYILLPFVLSLFLVVYLSIAMNSQSINEFIHLACKLGVEAEFANKTHASHKQKLLQEACADSYMYNVRHEIFWASLRCAVQGMLGAILLLWTVQRVGEITRARRRKLNLMTVTSAPSAAVYGQNVDMDDSLGRQTRQEPAPPYQYEGRS